MLAVVSPGISSLGFGTSMILEDDRGNRHSRSQPMPDALSESIQSSRPFRAEVPVALIWSNCKRISGLIQSFASALHCFILWTLHGNWRTG